MESPVAPITILLEVIRDKSPKSKWTDAPLEKFRHVENTNRGEIGEEFLRRFLKRHGIKAGNGSRVTPTDLRIYGARVEVKTASEDRGGIFSSITFGLIANMTIYCAWLSPPPRFSIMFGAREKSRRIRPENLSEWQKAKA